MKLLCASLLLTILAETGGRSASMQDASRWSQFPLFPNEDPSRMMEKNKGSQKEVGIVAVRPSPLKPDQVDTALNAAAIPIILPVEETTAGKPEIVPKAVGYSSCNWCIAAGNSLKVGRIRDVARLIRELTRLECNSLQLPSPQVFECVDRMSYSFISTFTAALGKKPNGLDRTTIQKYCQANNFCSRTSLMDLDDISPDEKCSICRIWEVELDAIDQETDLSTLDSYSIREILLGICYQNEELTSKPDKCVTLMDHYEQDIVAHLSNDVDPIGICNILELCGFSIALNDLDITPEEKCSTCRIWETELSKMYPEIGDYSSTELVSILHSMCITHPQLAPQMDKCQAITDQFQDEIVHFLINNNQNPSDLCNHLEICVFIRLSRPATVLP
ncbi:unnamed protein product [Darwinula stevensoni]|uniref:Saposin B-type domain-containing protein n=1 Tax=Darwinula stevensoni TaxID=69355 RepID=A0A7R8XF12_9CRUS|nr:unnamed protein product [Darwinula stevensoni]CAG0890236.1 unnamed protein product [Darwinula stevensoni]